MPSHSPRTRRFLALAVIAIVAAIVVAYGGTLDGPFAFDDLESICENEAIRDPSRAFAQSGRRGVAYFTFALNYAAHGLWPRGYRITNVAIHCLAALALFGFAYNACKQLDNETAMQKSPGRWR